MKPGITNLYRLAYDLFRDVLELHRPELKEGHKSTGPCDVCEHIVQAKKLLHQAKIHLNGGKPK